MGIDVLGQNPSLLPVFDFIKNFYYFIGKD
jgi:hypothetical protein